MGKEEIRFSASKLGGQESSAQQAPSGVNFAFAAGSAPSNEGNQRAKTHVGNRKTPPVAKVKGPKNAGTTTTVTKPAEKLSSVGGAPPPHNVQQKQQTQGVGCTTCTNGKKHAISDGMIAEPCAGTSMAGMGAMDVEQHPVIQEGSQGDMDIEVHELAGLQQGQAKPVSQNHENMSQ